MKKILIISLVSIISTGVHAWEIEKNKDETFLVDKKLEVKEKVFALEKSPVEVVKLSKEVIVLRYLETKAGTKDITQTFNCALFNLSNKKMLGVDQLCKTITTKPDGKSSEVSATFKVEKNQVVYSFEELDDTFPLK